ncbi:MAG: glycosyltransferase family 4 protein [Verrucomicrobiota bacterium]
MLMNDDSGAILILLAEYPVWSEAFLYRGIQSLCSLDCRFRVAALRGLPSVNAPTASSTSTVAAPAHPSVDILTPAVASQAVGRSHPRLPRSLSTLGTRLRHRSALRPLLRHCEQHNVRHIHAEFCDLPAYLARAAAERLGISHSVGAHARDVFCCKYSLPKLLRDARFVTVCNSAAEHELLRQGAVARDRLHLIHHGLPLSEWPFVEPPSSHGKIRFLWAGRMVPKKGLDLLLRSLARWAEQPGSRPRWQLTMIGGGSEKPRLQALVRDLGIAEHITWRLPLPTAKLQQEFAEADALILPARIADNGDRDGIPNVALEAMATGLAVIATPTGGLPDIARTDTAWIANSANVEDLAEALDAFAHCAPQEASARRQRAREQVEDRFDLAVTTPTRQKLFNHYLQRS